MDNLFVFPKSGLIVRDPITGKSLPEDGANKPRTSYWLRRLRDGDVHEGKAPAKPKAAAAVTTPTPKGEAK